MGMEAADPMRTPRARNASFNHAPTIRGYRGSIISGPAQFELAARPLLSISAFRAKFGLGVIWLSEVRVGVLFQGNSCRATRRASGEHSRLAGYRDYRRSSYHLPDGIDFRDSISSHGSRYVPVRPPEANHRVPGNDAGYRCKSTQSARRYQPYHRTNREPED